MDEARLIEKLRRIEALHAGATTPGERVAAGRARERILGRLRETEVLDPPIEYRFTMADVWSRRVFLALLRRYEIRPYRYPRQRHTTVMARVSRRFVDETLWPEFEQISDSLRDYLSDVTDRVIAEALDGDGSEAEVVETPPQLDLGSKAGGSPAPAIEPEPESEPAPPPPASHPQPELVPPVRATTSGKSAGGSKRKRKTKKTKRKRR